MSVNGGEPSRVYGNANMSIESLYVTDDYIYFTSSRYFGGNSNSGSIYKMSVNGGEPSVIYGSANIAIEDIFIK